MKELKSSRELKNACKKKGFILIIKKPIKNSRIHSTSCYSLHNGVYGSNFSEHDLGESKAKALYYFSEIIDELTKKIKSDAIRDIENLLCAKCNAKQQHSDDRKLMYR